MKTQNPASPATLAGMADYVIESGETTVDGGMVWYWRKWASGTAECWGTMPAKTVSVTDDWGGVYCEPPSTAIYFGPYNYPFAFAQVPQEVVTPRYWSGDTWLSTATLSNINTRTGRYQAIRGTAKSDTKLQVAVFAIGKWK